MICVEVSQAQCELPRLLAEVAKGQIVKICQDNVPVAELHPAPLPPVPPGQKRPIGLCKDKA